MNSIFKRIDVPPFWTLLALILVEAINRIVNFYDLHKIIGKSIPVLLLLIALIYIILASRAFIKNKTTIHPHGTPKRLITDGIYKVSRNPIYTGFALIIFAFVLYRGELLGILALLAFVFIITERFIKHEEAILLAQFPEAREWFARSRRW